MFHICINFKGIIINAKQQWNTIEYNRLKYTFGRNVCYGFFLLRAVVKSNILILYMYIIYRSTCGNQIVCSLACLFPQFIYIVNIYKLVVEVNVTDIWNNNQSIKQRSNVKSARYITVYLSWASTWVQNGLVFCFVLFLFFFCFLLVRFVVVLILLVFYFEGVGVGGVVCIRSVTCIQCCLCLWIVHS